MIIKSEKVKIVGKGERSGEKNGRLWTSKDVYFQDKDGTTIQTAFNNDVVYNKAVENKDCILKVYLSPNGRFNLNDIEL